MIPATVAIAVLVAVGATAALTTRVPRAAILGLLVALTGSPFVTDPLPAAAPLAARIIGGVLAAYLVFAALRHGPAETRGSAFGWPGAMALLIVVLAAGWLAAGNGAALLASMAAAQPLSPPAGGAGDLAGIPGGSLAAGSPIARAGAALAVALAALAIPPLVLLRDALRLVIGLLLLVTSIALIRGAIGAGADPAGDAVAELALAVVTALVGMAGAAIVRGAAHRGDLGLRDRPGREPVGRAHRVDDAHPMRPQHRAP